MLTLSVFRDGTLHGQAELTANGLRIGRGAENDIVLEDAAKRVSRLHAELRLEPDGGIVLTDLQSANGTWIAGDRIETERLEPGIPFTIGPYRLMLDEQPDSEGGYATGTSGDASLARPPASVPGAPPAPAGHRRREDTTKTQIAWKVAVGAMDLAVRHRWATLIGGGAIVLLGGLGIWAMSAGPPPPPPEEHPTVDPVKVPEVPPAPPPVDPRTQHLDEADRLLSLGDTASAHAALNEHILPVLQEDPANARALDQKVVAERIISPPPQPGPRTPTPVPVKPDPRRVQLEARLVEGRTALERGDFRTAIQVLENLTESAPDFPDAKSVLQQALAARAEAGRRQLSGADEHAKAGRLPEAVEALRRAAATDPSLDVSVRIKELQALMLTEGEAAFIAGYNYSMSQRADQAIPMLRKAYAYLPDRHPDKAKAREELERLGAGVR